MKKERRLTMKRFYLIAVATIAFVFSYGSSAFADGSAWLPAPGEGSVTLSYVWQNADEFYRASTKGDTPAGGEDLTQQTVWINGTYGFSDSVAIDLRTGFARGSFTEEVPPAKADDEDGLTDVNLGVTWRIVDEVVSSAPSIAVRLGGTKSGSYDTGYINSIGDGADGFEVSGIIGKFITDQIALSGEVGYRYRHDIPNNVFVNLSGGVLLLDRIGISVNYNMTNAESGLDIGDPDFNPGRFPETEEDIHILGSALSVAISEQLSLGASYGRVIDGRNTAASDILSVSLGYSF
jgi:hypothetical protein